MKRFYSSLRCVVVLGLAALAQAQSFTTLYNFTDGSDGGLPYAGVIQDPAGNLYGTTYYGGDSEFGAVFEVSTAGTEKVLYSFSYAANAVAPLARDKAGNIYGTTAYGGSANCYIGCGVVFKIDSAGKETVLHKFTGGSDGCYPEQGLIEDTSGNLFGTTSGTGCPPSNGTIFKINSARKFTLLYSFAGQPSSGAAPEFGHLKMDEFGNLYGVTTGGGAYGYGALYKLSKGGTLTLLHSFKGGSDGCSPFGSVARDSSGNFYGTTFGYTCSSDGTIWKVSKKGNETILHNFAGGTSDGCNPYAGVTRDSKGNLYGVAALCGAYGSNGALYELSTGGRLTLLHSFDNSDGAEPIGEVLRTAKGTLFGTANGGGTYGAGTVWSYVP
jgi:uncharacterized repeat protein (TIGR03803 family)